MIIKENQLRKILKEYICYYNEPRHNQGIDEITLQGMFLRKKVKLLQLPILSGLHHHYFREAA